MNLRASSAYRHYACYGSFWAESHLPEPKPGADAINGTENHRAIAEMVKTGKTAEELGRTAERDIWLCNLFARETLNVLGGADRIIFEEPLVWHGMALPWSGHPDVFGVFDGYKRASVIDYKTGFAGQVDVDEHIQLRVYVALLYLYYDERFETIETWLFSAGEKGDQQIRGPICYDKPAIKSAVKDIAELATRVAHASCRSPGPHCRYCRACGHAERCPESCKTVELAIRDESMPVSPGLMADYLGKAKLAKTAIANMEAMAKEMLAAGTVIPGWRLKDGAKQKEITDVGEAYRLLRGHLGDNAVPLFLSACSVSLPELAKALYATAKANGETITRPAARAMVDDVLASVVEEKQRSPSLERIES